MIITPHKKRERKKIPKICQHCNRTYLCEITRKHQKYCSHSCACSDAHLHRPKPTTRQLIFAGKNKANTSASPPPTEKQVQDAVARYLSGGGAIQKAPPQLRDAKLAELLPERYQLPDGRDPIPAPMREAIAESKTVL